MPFLLVELYTIEHMTSITYLACIVIISCQTTTVLQNSDKTAKASLSAGFEPAREDPNGFLVHRLNHSATTTDGEHLSGLKNITLMFFSSSSSIQFYGATVPADAVTSPCPRWRCCDSGLQTCADFFFKYTGTPT